MNYEDVELYHGGKYLEYSYYDMIPSKTNRWEYGPGLYLTNNADLAEKYAKGSRKLYKIIITSGTNIKNVKCKKSEMIDFINDYAIKSKRKPMINFINKYDTDEIPISILVNLCINDKALNPKQAIELRKFLVSHGVDYSIDTYSFNNNTKIIVVYNPKIIKKVQIVKKTQIDNPTSDIRELE